MLITKYEENTCNITSLGEIGGVHQAMNDILNITATAEFRAQDPSKVNINYNSVKFELHQEIIWLAHNMPVSDPVGQLVQQYESAQETMKEDLAVKAATMQPLFQAPREIITAACTFG